jgi:hypothetical protein
MRRLARFTQADVARCIRAAQQCGASHVLILPDGTIEIKLQANSSPRDDAPRSSSTRCFGERLGGCYQQPLSLQEKTDTLIMAFDQFMRGEITTDQLPAGKYPNGMRVYADGEWEAIVRSRPLGKRERFCLEQYFEADGALKFVVGGPDTNERLEIRGLIEVSGPHHKDRTPHYRITQTGKAEWVRLSEGPRMKN